LLKFSLIPRGDKFFDLFEASAENILKAAEGLKDLTNTWDNVEERITIIKEFEHEGDIITHQIMERLHRTFITPFDREDIVLLAQGLDDVTDFIEEAADAMVTYKVKRPDWAAIALSDVILRGAREIQRGLPHLRKRSDFKHILEHCVEINRLENEADHVLRTAMGALFTDTTDVAEIIKWRDIYAHMESATDSCEDVADVLEGVALKHA